MRKSRKANNLERSRKNMAESTLDHPISPEIAAQGGTAEHKDMETTINTAKGKIKADGEFPTTLRLVAETGYTAEEIGTYFETRLIARREGKTTRHLLSMIGYLPSAASPLSDGRPLARIPDYSMGKRG